MVYTSLLLLSGILSVLSSIASASFHHRVVHGTEEQSLLYEHDADSIPLSTREHWMRHAISALKSPCPFAAFGSVIVNHTGQPEGGLGELICTGANRYQETGNPTLHGEIAAINNCTTVLSASPYNLSPGEIITAWKDLTLYTTAEPCAMCATAISWANFAGYVYATSLWTLIDMGWFQVSLGSREVLARRPDGGRDMEIVGDVLENDTDPLFAWQFQDGRCPVGCKRPEGGVGGCTVA